MLNKITDIYDIIPGLFWLGLILFFAHYKFRTKQELGDAKYYLTNVYFKIVLASIFVIAYAVLYNGGDTMAYYQGGTILDNLFFESPSNYISELNTEPTAETFRTNFNDLTGYPPGWIYREPESFIISKMISVLSIITFKSYWAITFILAFIVSHCNFKLYQLVKSYFLLPNKIAAICILFIPSVSFWCTGISKDTVVYITILIAIVNGSKVLAKRAKIVSWQSLYFIIALIILSQIRTFLLFSIILPLFMALNVALAKRYKKQGTFLFFIRTTIIIIGFASIFVFITNDNLGGFNTNSILEEAKITQQDFALNKTYGTDRYDLNVSDYSMMGLLLISPKAILAGIYRPFPWEGLKVALLINILESLALIILTLLFFFKKNFWQRVRFITKYEILIFSLYFSLILAFMTGFSSGLFGVLVRLRAPLLPFIFLFLCAGIWGLSYKEKINKQRDGINLRNAKSK